VGPQSCTGNTSCVWVGVQSHTNKGSNIDLASFLNFILYFALRLLEFHRRERIQFIICAASEELNSNVISRTGSQPVLPIFWKIPDRRSRTAAMGSMNTPRNMDRSRYSGSET